jgi:soluble lytic murein transglycosylase
MLYQRYAKESGVPALLMMSITRQESLFDPSARSRAGALGIAQMMPKEGRKMAKKMKLRDFKIDDLFRVSLNLRMGFLHFKEYLKRFKNNVPLTLVAYNAGPNALKRWIKEWGKAPEADLDAFVEIAVGYRETRRYAPACQRWYSTYRHVFAGKK